MTDAPRLYVRKSSPAYRYAERLWQGVPRAEAAALLKAEMEQRNPAKKPNPAYHRQVMKRWRQRASSLVGFSANDVLVLRLMFAAEELQREQEQAKCIRSSHDVSQNTPNRSQSA